MRCDRVARDSYCLEPAAIGTDHRAMVSLREFIRHPSCTSDVGFLETQRLCSRVISFRTCKEGLPEPRLVFAQSRQFCHGRAQTRPPPLSTSPCGLPTQRGRTCSLSRRSRHNRWRRTKLSMRLWCAAIAPASLVQSSVRHTLLTAQVLGTLQGHEFCGVDRDVDDWNQATTGTEN